MTQEEDTFKEYICFLQTYFIDYKRISGIIISNPPSTLRFLKRAQMDVTIINKWIDERSDAALKKLLNNEPLTFEDNIIFALVGQREEMHRIEEKITDVKLDIRDIKADIKEFKRTNDDLCKEIISQTRWIVSAILALPVILKLIEAFFGK
jgi:hypothetical protein